MTWLMTTRNATTKMRVGWKLPVSQAFMKEIRAKKNRIPALAEAKNSALAGSFVQSL